MRQPLATKHRVRLGVGAVGLAMLVGCGRTSGFLRDASTVNEHQFQMNIASQRYERSVSGSSSIGSMFCIVPMASGAYRDAMAALNAQAKLQTNEVLENIREDHAVAVWFLIYCEESLIVSADVYELKPAGVPYVEPASNFVAPTSAQPLARWPATPDTYVPPSPPIVDAGLPTREADICERAYDHVGSDLPDVFRVIFPKAKFIATPPKPAFLAACAEQSDDVQLCLQAPFLKAHTEQCRLAFAELASPKKTRLFGTFLREW